MKSNKRSKNVKKRKIDCKRQKRQKENLWIGMGTVTMGPWKQLLLSALDSNSHLKHSSYFQLVPSFFPHLLFFSFFLSFFENIVCNCCFCYCFQATIGSNGRPSNRTLVFRGFQENTDQIQINTDSRTHKVPFIFLIYTL